MNYNTPPDILLIEDDENDAELTIRALKKGRLSNKLVHLKDGAEALDYIFATGEYAHRDAREAPGVILLDLNMPKISGITVLSQIKEDERTRYIPVVILTSSKDHPDMEKCYRLGANSYIVKPVEFDNFTKAMTEIGLYWVLLNHPLA